MAVSNFLLYCKFVMKKIEKKFKYANCTTKINQKSIKYHIPN